MLLVWGCTCGLSASEKHWAFQKVKRPELPAVQNQAWVRNSVDAFILAELEKHNIPAATAAGKRTLIRRAYLDLIGLPPSPAEASYGEMV